jgi:hypothetical protein
VINYTEGSSGQRDDNAVIFDLDAEPDGVIHVFYCSLPRIRTQKSLVMQSSRCKQCNQPLVEIDHWVEHLSGCSKCNRWQTSIGEWCRIAPDDIVAVRALAEIYLSLTTFLSESRFQRGWTR